MYSICFRPFGRASEPSAHKRRRPTGIRLTQLLPEMERRQKSDGIFLACGMSIHGCVFAAGQSDTGPRGLSSQHRTTDLARASHRIVRLTKAFSALFQH